MVLFVEHIICYAEAFEFDMDALVDKSIIKTLTSIQLTRYQDWLATNSPYGKRKGRYSSATLVRKINIIKGFLSFLYEYNYLGIAGVRRKKR